MKYIFHPTEDEKGVRYLPIKEVKLLIKNSDFWEVLEILKYLENFRENSKKIRLYD